MIPLLEPLFQGDWAPYGETLQCAPQHPPQAVAIHGLIEHPALLTRALHGHARRLGVKTPDLRAVASDWSMVYLWALLPAAAGAASVLRHALPLSARDMSLTMDSDGLPLQLHIRHEGHPMPESSTLARYDALLWRHLAPLFEALGQASRVPTKILWGNAARYLEAVLKQALVLTDHAPHIEQDLRTLLDTTGWPGQHRNPMYGPRRRIVRLTQGEPEEIELYRQCCLYYRLPGQGYCGGCPLSAENLAALKGRAPCA